jgi:hypothetical protein
MAQYNIDQDSYLLPTPAGAYYSVQSGDNDNIANYLRYLLSQPNTPKFSNDDLVAFLDPDIGTSVTLLHRMQSVGYIQGLSRPFQLPGGSLEDKLPPLLGNIVDSGKALLSDEQGFCISVSGFAHEIAEELAALSSVFHTTNKRYQRLLSTNLNISSGAWGVIDPGGNSKIGFWPLYFPRDTFMLILSGIPQLNTMEFTILISYLAKRYNN